MAQKCSPSCSIPAFGSANGTEPHTMQEMQNVGFDPCVGKTPGGHDSPVFLPGESQDERPGGL